VTDSHHTMVTFNRIKSEGNVPVNNIILLPLSFPIILQWIGDTFLDRTLSSNSSLQELAKLVHHKTEGNPFFVKIFLQTLFDERLVNIDQNNDIKWDIETIRNQQATDNVVDLMIRRIGSYEEDTKRIFTIASCLGNRFTLIKMSCIVDHDQSTIIQHLFPVLNAGMCRVVELEFCFTHDRVQEAAYSLMSEWEKQKMHYNIGTKLVNNYRLEAIDHLNKGRALLVQDVMMPDREGKLLELAKLNLEAALASKKSVAFPSVLGYLLIGISCFNETSNDAWVQHHALGYELHKELAIIYTILTEYEKANKVINELVQRARNRVEFGEIYAMRANQETIIFRFDEAIKAGLAGLSHFGVHFPEDEDEIKKQLEKERREIEQKMDQLGYTRGSMEKMKDLPPTDEEYYVLSSLLVVSDIQTCDQY
jgi:predicted ATPase